MPKQTAEDDPRQVQSEQYRHALASAYTFVESQKLVQSFSALTPEDLYDRFIERVSGVDTQVRPNALNRIAKVKADLLASVEKIKELPDDAFRRPDAEKDTNTSADANEENA